MFSFHSIDNYHKELLNGQTTCVEAVEFFLARIHDRAHLNAYIRVYDQEARERAKQLDNLRTGVTPLKKLHGVIISIKDVISYKGHPLTAASKILQGYTASYNATLVEKLLAEDAIIIGACNCDEFAMGSSNENSVYGHTLNAADESRVPGGSSGGSAVAVQAGLCMVSIGTDTGGSVRQPADFCGIVGMKPTYGRVSRHGLIAYASSFDQAGIFANNIPDTALVLETIAGADGYDSTATELPVPSYSTALTESLKPLRIGYFADALGHAGLDPEMSAVLSKYIQGLPSFGHQVEAIDFGLLDYIVPAYYVLTTAEASANLSRYDGVRYGYRAAQVKDLNAFYQQTRSEGFGAEVKRRILLGTFVLSAGYFDAYFTRAQRVRQKLVEKTAAIFRHFDAIVMPTVPATAFRFGEKSKDSVSMYLADIYTVYANLVGIPGISIPLFRHSNGLPFGLQIMTNRFSEVHLLAFAQQLLA